MTKQSDRSRWGWVFLCAILLLALALRLWQLDTAPPGLYRDEAYNGLDALDVLDGRTPLFFEANNGREPLYIYLTAASVAVFGRSAFAVRLPAALLGALAVLPVYALGRAWFDRRVGPAAAFLWAVTVWPIHLSRVGLRVVLLVPIFTTAVWLLTRAYRTRKPWVAVLAGLVYGLTFYTYLAGRLTPLVLGWFLVCLLIHHRHKTGRWWSAALGARLRFLGGWAGVGTAVALLPWGWLIITQPDIFLGRTGQVSIFSPAINQGDLWGTLLAHIGRALGLFVWQGDTIIRHNPPGRPLFTWEMAGPFLLGLGVMLHARKPAHWAIGGWIGIMLTATIFAEDAPHFLRAVGILPAALFPAAIGLAALWQWSPRNYRWMGRLITAVLCVSTLSITGRDYFLHYNQHPDTAYLFEAASRQLAQQINQSANRGWTAADRRFFDGWPSVRFLVPAANRPILIDEPARLTNQYSPPSQTNRIALYLWPHDQAALSALAERPPRPLYTRVDEGPLSRGDLEPEPYPLYVRYTFGPRRTVPPTAAWTLGDDEQPLFYLHQSTVRAAPDGRTLTVDLLWSTPVTPTVDGIAFVHLLDTTTGRLAAQSDHRPAHDYWPTPWWQPGRQLSDTRTLVLETPYDPARHQLFVGWYPVGRPAERLEVTAVDTAGENESWSGDAWPVPADSGN